MAVTLHEGVAERNEGQRVRGIGEEGEVRDELVLRSDLQVVAGLGLSVVHRILLHPHECGIMVCLGIRVAVTQYPKVAVIFTQLVPVGPELAQLSFLLPFLCLLLLVFRDGGLVNGSL